jgi:DNA-binding NarL/FixJ family response regulator
MNVTSHGESTLDEIEQWQEKLIEMKAAGYSQGKISRETGLAYNTVKNYLKRLTSANDANHRH